MSTAEAMKEWAGYVAKFNDGASRADMLKAAKNLKDGKNRKVAMLNLGITTAEDRKRIAARWESINAVTDKEAAMHCQFSGFFK